MFSFAQVNINIKYSYVIINYHCWFFYLSVLYKLLLIIFTILTSSNLQNLILDIRHATRGESGGRPPLPFFENRRNCPDLGKKSHDCVHLWVKFSIENIILRVSRRKNSKKFPCGAFFVLLMKCLSKCPNSTKPLLPWKISGCAPGYISNIPWFQFLL